MCKYTVLELESTDDEAALPQVVASGEALASLVERFALNEEEIGFLRRLEPGAIKTFGAYSFRREY